MRAARILALAVAVAGLGAAWFWLVPHGAPRAVLTGYVEGETLHFGAPVSGTVTRLDVERGQRVVAGAVLFQIDPGTAQAQLAQAEAEARAAQARLEDARKGQRPEELAVIEAQRAAAEATLEEAHAEYQRARTLTERGIAPRARLDQAKAAYQAAQAQNREVARRLDVAGLGSRDSQVAAAEAEVARARGAVAEARARLTQLAPEAPAPGLVEDVFFRPGEWVPANQALVALLPDARVKVRFFVPETALPSYRPGTRVRVACDGCESRMAEVSYVSPRAEFTPPVIYSRGSRETLVFMVEAVPERPRGLAPGQPVDIVLEP